MADVQWYVHVCYFLCFIFARAFLLSEIIYAVSTQTVPCIVMGVADDILLSTPFTRLQLQRTKREIKRGHNTFEEKDK